MSLATRCTSCGTVFRIVQDQLKVSEGWVRCGRCNAVFDATPGLFDLALEAPPAWAPPTPSAEGPIEPPVSRFDAPTNPPIDAPSKAPAIRPPAHPADAMGPDWGRRLGPTGNQPASSAPTSPATAAAESPVAPPPRATAAAASRSANGPVVPVEPTFSALAGVGPLAAEAPAPGFVRRGRREAFWRSWGGIAASWGVGLVLLVALAAQAAEQFSDIAAARWPALRPALVRWCGWTGCSVAAPRRIDELVVDSSALAPVAGTSALRLGVALRNRAAFAVAIPSVDLSLSDTAGRLVARRALQPTDFQVTTRALEAGSELALQALITTSSAPVAGYTVEIFYP